MMQLKVIGLIGILLASLVLAGCDSATITEEQASKAGEILKRWQDQNR